MALTQRQIACFEKNTQFLNEVAAALLPLASDMIRQAMVVENNEAATAVERTFAAIRKQIANQILTEQGINIQGGSMAYPTPGGVATSGSTAMKYLVQQMLLLPDWTLTPDQWAADEVLARATITTAMASLVQGLTAIPS